MPDDIDESLSHALCELCSLQWCPFCDAYYDIMAWIVRA